MVSSGRDGVTRGGEPGECGMRKSQCKFCTSRKCNHRIVTPDLTYDEIACVRHFKELAEHSDNTLKGAGRAILETTGQVKRGEPYPFDAAATN